MPPIIGLTHSIHLDEQTLHTPLAYPDAIRQSGGIPLLIPATTDESILEACLNVVDGVLFSGGDDIDPLRYGESQVWQCGDICPLRDEYELTLARLTLKRGLPVLGICRGIQLLNVALGGTLYQDLPSQLPGCMAHRQHQVSTYVSHTASIPSGSRLHDIYGADEIHVNSHHHQALKALGQGLIATAVAPDGVIEGVEMPDHPFFVGVQWHPEKLVQRPVNAAHKHLFEAFVQACTKP